MGSHYRQVKASKINANGGKQKQSENKKKRIKIHPQKAY
jgi:hypothetical protein